MKTSIFNIYKYTILGRPISQWLMILGILSIFIPEHTVTTIIIMVISSIFLISHFVSPDCRRILENPAFGYIMASLPFFIVPPIVYMNPIGIFEGFFYWYSMIFICNIFSYVTTKTYNKIIDLMLVMSIICVAYGIFKIIFFDMYRTGSLFINPNIYAYAVEIFICTAFYRYKCTGRKIYIFVILINFIGLYLTNCRTAWPVLAIAVGIYLIKYVKKLYIIFIAGFVVVGAAVGIMYFMPRMDLGNLLISMDDRLSIWQAAWVKIFEEPVMGHGQYYFFVINEQFGLDVPHAHNLVFNVLFEYGMVGLCFFSVLLGKYYGALIANRKYSADYDHIGRLISILSVCFALHGLTDCVIAIPNAYLLTMIMMSGAFVERNERMNKRLIWNKKHDLKRSHKKSAASADTQ